MLELSDAALLVDALRPPAGMQLVAAVGTTFTLDLASLLAIPVAASFSGHGPGEEDAASLLETIRRYADSTVLFCQAGAIAVPHRYRAALTFLEGSVIEVRKPPGGIFHPKVWAVRFRGGGRELHRILVMSRNLTFDRALDVMVRLDEDPGTTKAVDTSSLASLLRDLVKVGHAARPVSKVQDDLVRGIAASISKARFAVPEPFDRGRLVSGLPGARGTPFHRTCDHVLAVSPFLTPLATRQLLGTATSWSGIISRRASLDQIATWLSDATEVSRVKDSVLNAQASVDSLFEADAGNEETATAGELASMRGLHAKLYIQDHGPQSTVWMGSTNLTAAGFGANYEMLIELVGPKRAVGVDATLDPARKRRDLSLLVEAHELADAPAIPEEDEPEISAIEGLAYDLASRNVRLSATPEEDLWRVELRITPTPELDEVELAARPLSLAERDFEVVQGGTAEWKGLHLTALTPFLVLRIRSHSARRTILLRADLDGDPGSRRGAVLAHAIRSRDDFLMYLAAMLGHMGDAASPPPGSGRGDREKGSWLRGIRADRVLEDLLTTLSRAPERLDSLSETLRQLDAHADTRDYVPEEFRELWQAVSRVHRGRSR